MKAAICAFTVQFATPDAVNTANIIINDGIRDYVISNQSFSSLLTYRTAQFETNLAAPQTNVTLTVTATGGDLGSNVYSGTISGVTIRETDDNIFEVTLTKQAN